MRKEISSERYIKMIYADLCEMFEVMIQQRYFLDVINTSEGICSRLYEYDSDAGIYNVSHLYQHSEKDAEGKTDIVMRSAAKSCTYFEYDSLSDALAHANELFSVISDSV